MSTMNDEDKAIGILLHLRTYNDLEWELERACVVVRETNSGDEHYQCLGDDNILTSDQKHEALENLTGIRCARVGSTLYYIGGQRSSCTLTDNDMLYIDTSNQNIGWKKFTLPFYSCRVKTVVYQHYIYMFPVLCPFYYRGVDDFGSSPQLIQLPKNPSQPYLYNTKKEEGQNIELPTHPFGLRIPPPRYDPKKKYSVLWTEDYWPQFFPGFRVCAPWDDRGLLISVFGDTRFYLHDPVQKKWTHLGNFDPLPDFPGRLPTQNVYPLPIINSLSVIVDCKLYVFDLPDLDGSPKLHVYDLNKGKLDFSQDLPNLSLDLSLYCPNFSLSYCDWQMLALGEGLLLFLGYVEEKDDNFGEGKFIYLKVKVLEDFVEVVKDVFFRLPFQICELYDCMLYDPHQLQFDPKDFKEFENKVAKIQGSTLEEEWSYKSTYEDRLERRSQFTKTTTSSSKD